MSRWRFVPPAAPEPIRRNICLTDARQEQLDLDTFISPSRGEDAFVLFGLHSGRLSCLVDQSTFILSEGQAFILAPETPAILRTLEPCAVDYLVLSGSLPSQLLTESCREGCFLPRGGSMIHEIVSRLRNTRRTQADPDGRMASSAAFDALVQVYGQGEPFEKSAYPQLVAAAGNIICQDFAELSGIDQLAKRLGVTKSHLIRVFNTALGMPPGRYLSRVRIEHAKYLLRTQNATIESISAACGFASASYFGKVFRRYTGLSPCEYAAAGRTSFAPMQAGTI